MSSTCALRSAISQSIASLNELIQLLQEERIAMEARDTTTMQMILAPKSTLINELQKAADMRSNFLAARDYTEDEPGLLEYLASLPQNDAQYAFAEWEILKAKLEECKAENAVNSKIVHRSKHHIEQLLNLMRGQETSAKVYTHAGAERSVSQSQSLAEA